MKLVSLKSRQPDQGIQNSKCGTDITKHKILGEKEFMEPYDLENAILLS